MFHASPPFFHGCFPGVRDGEEVPSGLKTWNDALGKSGKSGGMKNGAGWIAEYKGSKKQSQTRWFNVRTWGSWRLAFLLAKLQRQLWEASGSTAPKAAVEAPKVIAPSRNSSAKKLQLQVLNLQHVIARVRARARGKV